MQRIASILLGISFLLCCISCEKDKHSSEYCINRISDKPAQLLVNNEEMLIIKTLFETNHLNYSNYQFYRLETDQIGYQHARCYQFVNGLKVFYNELIFHFDPKGGFSSLSGNIIEGIPPGNNPSMCENNIVAIFLAEISKDEYYKHNFESLKSGCFDIEFGYYDLNTDLGIKDRRYTKAWKVTPKGTEYPVAFINDINSSVLYFFNGVITMKKSAE